MCDEYEEEDGGGADEGADVGDEFTEAGEEAEEESAGDSDEREADAGEDGGTGDVADGGEGPAAVCFGDIVEEIGGVEADVFWEECADGFEVVSAVDEHVEDEEEHDDEPGDDCEAVEGVVHDSGEGGECTGDDLGDVEFVEAVAEAGVYGFEMVDPVVDVFGGTFKVGGDGGDLAVEVVGDEVEEEGENGESAGHDDDGGGTAADVDFVEPVHGGFEDGGDDETEIDDEEEAGEFVKEESGGGGEQDAEGDGEGHGHGAFDGGGGGFDDFGAGGGGRRGLRGGGYRRKGVFGGERFECWYLGHLRVLRMYCGMEEQRLGRGSD